MHHILALLGQSIAAQAAPGGQSSAPKNGEASFPDLLKMMASDGKVPLQTITETVTLTSSLESNHPALSPQQPKPKTPPQPEKQAQAPASSAGLLEQAKQLLALAGAVSDIAADQSVPAQSDKATASLESALIEFVAQLQEVPLDTRMSVAESLVADLGPQAEFLPVIQIMKSQDPSAALNTFLKQSAVPTTTTPRPAGKPDNAMSDPSEPERPLVVATSPQAKPTGPISPSSFAPTEIQDEPNQTPKLQLAAPPQTQPRSHTETVGLVPSEQTAEGETLPIAAPRNVQKNLSPIAGVPPAEKPQGVIQNPAVNPNIVVTETVEPAELRNVTSVDTTARAQPAADPSTSFTFARNVAAQLRGKTFEDGKTRVELSPRGLGDIEVEVARDDMGKHRVVLRVENPAVLTAFRQDREALLSVLRESGLDFDEHEVGFEEFGGHGFGQQRQQEFTAPLARQLRVSNVAPEQTEIAAHQINSGPVQHGLDIVT